MAIVRQSAAQANGSSTTPTFSKPATLNNGDVLVVSFGVRASSNVSAVPSGWTLVDQNVAQVAARAWAYYKVITDAASEPASYAWTLDLTGAWAGGIVRYSGVDNATPLDVTAANASGNSLGPAVGGITTVTAAAMIAAFVVIDATTSTTIVLNDSFVAEVWDTTTGIHNEYDDGAQAVAGDTTPVDWTLSPAARQWAAILFALRPTLAAQPKAFQEFFLGPHTDPAPLGKDGFADPFQRTAFQRPEQVRISEGFQGSAFQRPDWAQAFQDTAFDDEGFQEAAEAFHDLAFEGDAFQQDERPAAATPSVTGVGAIGSAEAFGTARIIRILANAGAIGTGEAFGTTKLIRILRNAGAIQTAEAFGSTAKVRRILAPVGLASLEVFGTTHVLFRVYPLGVTTAEAFGQPTVSPFTPPAFVVSGVGAIASLEAFGTTKVIRMLQRVGAVSSAETFGTTRALFIVRNVGAIVTAEAFGQNDKVIRMLRNSGGIASAESFGTTKVRFIVYPLGIASAEAFGRPTIIGGIQGAYQVSGVGAIASLEAFGTTKTIRILRPIMIVSGEAFGTSKTNRIVRNAGAITGAEAFGQTDRVLRVMSPVSIVSAEAFGQTARLKRILGLLGIAPTEAFGVTRVIGGSIVDFPSAQVTIYLSDVALAEMHVSDAVLYESALADLGLAEINISDATLYESALADLGLSGINLSDLLTGS